jgi:hypothetical protein
MVRKQQKKDDYEQENIRQYHPIWKKYKPYKNTDKWFYSSI